MTVHASPDYAIDPDRQFPASALAGYPTTHSPSTFQTQPGQESAATRRASYIQHCLANPAPRNTKPIWHELVRMEGGAQPHEGVIESSLEFINNRKDCSDFVLHGVLWLLYQKGYKISPALAEKARQTVLNFKYFPDEPGIDSLCTWTENHYILYTSAAYLAGQLYPNEVFANSGHSGQQKMDLNRPRILRWLKLRFQTGFSEWLSHVYYDEDLAALLSLHTFCHDPEITRKAEMVIDLLLLDIALNSFKGVFGSTHGRSYENTKKRASNEGTTDTTRLLFGTGVYSGFDNMSAAAFALGRYQVPPAILAIALNPPTTLENRQRMGIRLDEMEKWGIQPTSFEDGMVYLTLEAYMHPRTAENTLDMFDICNWWENDFLNAFKPYRGLLKFLRKTRILRHFVRPLERDVCRNTREEVNISTYRTPDYMLSTAQDYRKGYGGDQQHIWQATLAPNAVCFTTHPAKLSGASPNYWSGSGLLPRAAQYKNLAIILYKLEKIPALYVPTRLFFSHAWLHVATFDEVHAVNGWVFARWGDGYLALYASQPGYWTHDQLPKQLDQLPQKLGEIHEPPPPTANEWVCPGQQTAWLCQLGRKEEDGSFQNFIQAITHAPLSIHGLEVRYHAPGIGPVSFGWDAPLEVNEVPVPLSGYPRYDNAFAQVGFGALHARVEANGHSLEWDFEEGRRQESILG